MFKYGFIRHVRGFAQLLARTRTSDHGHVSEPTRGMYRLHANYEQITRRERGKRGRRGRRPIREKAIDGYKTWITYAIAAV